LDDRTGTTKITAPPPVAPSQAARENKTSLATVLRYFSGDFTKRKGARQYSVSTSDKHVNQVRYLGENGYESFLLRGSREASRQGTYLNDIKRRCVEKRRYSINGAVRRSAGAFSLPI